jgi:hypothetical protein
MANTYVDYIVSDVNDTTYSFTKDFLELSHIKVYYQAAEGSDFVEYTIAGGELLSITGSSGSAVITLDSSVIPTDLDAVIRIMRITPQQDTGRLVNWTGGAQITSADLDTAALQSQYIAEEAHERSVYFGLAPIDMTDLDGQLDAKDLRITSVADPEDAQDAATKAYVDTATAGQDHYGATYTATEMSTSEQIFDITAAWSRMPNTSFAIDTTNDWVKITRADYVKVSVYARMANRNSGGFQSLTAKLRYKQAPTNKADLLSTGSTAWTETQIVPVGSASTENVVSVHRSWIIDCSAATSGSPIAFAVSFTSSNATDTYMRSCEIVLETV